MSMNKSFTPCSVLLAIVATAAHSQTGNAPPSSLQTPAGALQQPVQSAGKAAPALQAPALAAPHATPDWGKAAKPAAPPLPSALPPPSHAVPGVQGMGAASNSPIGKDNAATANLQLAEVLKRPDGDVITAADGKKMTVGEIRKIVKQREQLIADFKAGKGRASIQAGQSVKLDSPRRVQLLQAHGQLRDAQNRQAVQARGSAVRQLASIDAHAVVQAPAGTAFSGAGKAAALQRSVGAAPHVNTQKGIWLVNGQDSGFQLTPGGEVTLTGLAFGAAAGRVRVVGVQGAPGGVIEMALVQPGGWSDTEIHAQVPTGVRGIPDQNNINVQVATTVGTSYSLPGGKFFAAREEVLVKTGIDRLMRLTPPSAAGWPWAPTLDAQGAVSRFAGLRPMDCAAPGHDDLTPILRSNGFEVSGVTMWHGRTDSGDGDGFGHAGSRNFAGRYGVAWQGDRLIVDWGVWRSHWSPMGPIEATDWCTSDYQLALSVVGPAGVAPF